MDWLLIVGIMLLGGACFLLGAAWAREAPSDGLLVLNQDNEPSEPGPE